MVLPEIDEKKIVREMAEGLSELGFTTTLIEVPECQPPDFDVIISRIIIFALVGISILTLILYYAEIKHRKKFYKKKKHSNRHNDNSGLSYSDRNFNHQQRKRNGSI